MRRLLNNFSINAFSTLFLSIMLKGFLKPHDGGDCAPQVRLLTEVCQYLH